METPGVELLLETFILLISVFSMLPPSIYLLLLYNVDCFFVFLYFFVPMESSLRPFLPSSARCVDRMESDQDKHAESGKRENRYKLEDRCGSV